MRHLTDAPLRSFDAVTRFRPTDYLLSVICVMRLSLAVNDVCQPLPKAQQPLAQKSKRFEDGMGSSPRFGGHLAPFKPRTDVTLMGSAYVPHGGKAESLRVTFGVGEWRKSLDILGDQNWVRGSQVGLSPHRPFSSMMLRMENAFGGIGSQYNPWGKGFGRLGEDIGATLPVCNIHAASERHARWDAQVPPAGFGPLPEELLPRVALRGTYDDTWLYQRSPLPPKDFDWGFYNVAPPDQQFSPYLRANEVLYFENLHPSVPVFASRLPGLHPRVLIRRHLPEQEEPQILELPTSLNSIHVDMDEMTVDLAWHAVASTPDEKAREVSHSFVVLESVEGPAAPLSEHALAFQALVDPVPSPPPPPPTPPARRKADKLEQDALRDLQKRLKRLPLSRGFKKDLRHAKTPAQAQKALEVEGKRVIKTIEEALAKQGKSKG